MPRWTAARFSAALSEPPTETEQARFADAVAQRERRIPVAQIIGQRSFWGRDFIVTRDTLDPRPETETLIAVALEAGPAKRILDLGTGTGCLLLTLLAEWRDATGVGTDISAQALEIAERNALALGLTARARFLRSDWFSALSDPGAGDFDLIVSNPPYIAEGELALLAPEVRDHEPHSALTPGGDGLDAYRAIAAGVAANLAPQGRLLLEIGPTQAADVAALLTRSGLVDITTHRDFDGRDRVIVGNRATK